MGDLITLGTPSRVAIVLRRSLLYTRSPETSEVLYMLLDHQYHLPLYVAEMSESKCSYVSLVIVLNSEVSSPFFD